MKRKLGLKFILLLLSLFTVGCLKHRVKLDATQRLLPAKDATWADLLRALQQKSAQIETLKGTIAVEYSSGGAKTGVLDEYRETKGYVFVVRPAHIRVQVQAPLL